MVLGHDEVWWSAVAAIGQVLGAVATFAAVLVSLWIVTTDRSLRGRGYAKILVSFVCDGSPGIYHVGFGVENSGIRDFLVQSISWRTGWWKWGPDWAKFRYAIQTSGTGHMFENRWVKASLSETFLVKISEMKVGLGAEGERGELLRRRHKILGWAPVRAYANVAGSRPIPLRVDKALPEFLRTGEHADTTD